MASVSLKALASDGRTVYCEIEENAASKSRRSRHGSRKILTPEGYLLSTCFRFRQSTGYPNFRCSKDIFSGRFLDPNTRRKRNADSGNSTEPSLRYSVPVRTVASGENVASRVIDQWSSILRLQVALSSSISVVDYAFAVCFCVVDILLLKIF